MPQLTLANLQQLRETFPGVYEDLRRMEDHLNMVTKMLGGFEKPTASGSIAVTGTNGIIDIQITDFTPASGEEYFLEYSPSPSFVDAHVVPLGPTRNFRTGNLNGLTTYWRWYKSNKLGGRSGYVVLGDTSPTAVAPGNLSTASSGPSPSASRGSGLSQIPGHGYGTRTQPGAKKFL